MSCNKSRELNNMRTAGSPFSVNQDWRQCTGRQGNSRVFLSFPLARHGFFRSLACSLNLLSRDLLEGLLAVLNMGSVVESDKCGKRELLKCGL